MSRPLPPLQYPAVPTAPEVVEGDDPAILEAVARRDVGLAIWHRPMRGEVARWLDGLAPAGLPAARLLLRPAQARQAAAGLFPAPATPGQAALTADIARLVQVFAGLTGQTYVDMRLAALKNDACWRFHCDRVRLRLLCTYRGPATQWVPAAEAHRALQAQRDYDGPLRELPRFAVALFKGALAAGETGVVHRSPSLADSGVTRLFLCLNEPTSVSPPPWDGF